jgi:LmbE family N-acetylglucosaminyl deacetylase
MKSAWILGRAALGAVEENILVLYWRILRSVAREATALVGDTSALVLAPHPDDETLACGGLIARKRAGGMSVWIAVASDGSRSHRSQLISPQQLSDLRRKELFTACRELGVHESSVFWLGLPDQELRQMESDLTARFEDLIRALRPGEIYIPTRFDSHPDHRAVHRAAKRALSRSGHSCQVWEYPVWFWGRKAWIDEEAGRLAKIWQLFHRPLSGLVALRPCVVRVDQHGARKLRAVEAYRSQTCNLTGEADWAVLGPKLLSRFLMPEELLFDGGFLPEGRPS